MYNFKFADIGEGIHEGQILKWMFNVGDTVKEGDTLCLIETDKVNAEIPSPVSGKITEIPYKVGDVIHVGETLVLIDDGSTNNLEDGSPATINKIDGKKAINEGEEDSASVVGEIEVSSEVIETSHEAVNSKEEISQKVLATPVARKLAKDLGIDINTIKGTGPVGRVMKEDIYKVSETKTVITENKVEAKKVEAPKIVTTGDVERVPISKLRKTIAKNMVISKSTIPHASTMDEYDVTELVAFRTKEKELATSMGISLTYMPFIIKAVYLTLKDFPIFNASFDSEKDEIIYKKFYNIGIAVDTEEGLIVPVIKNVDRKSIFTLAKELTDITTKAKSRSLSLDQLQDGTFTITNYGAFGSTYGVPVIRYPEVAIVGIGKISKKPVVIDDQIVIREMMPVSLSIDHRIIDGGDAGRFLMRLKEYLSNPMLLLLS